MTDKEMIHCQDQAKQMQRLLAIVHRLRAPGGCPWDAEQTHESIIPHLIEETYETIDTIRRGDMEHLREELGDVLLQVVFHSEIATEAGHFTFEDVAKEVAEKMIRRHPHVYGEKNITKAEEVLRQWNEIKATEKPTTTEASYLDEVGKGLPPFLKAVKLQKKAAKVGFDWTSLPPVIDKIKEELQELEDELKHHIQQAENPTPENPTPENVKNELGDLFFALVNLSRKLKLNPDELIERTNLKFVQRFSEIEKSLKNKGETLENASLETMDELWEQQKVKK